MNCNKALALWVVSFRGCQLWLLGRRTVPAPAPSVSFADCSYSDQVGCSFISPSTAYLYDWNMLPLGQVLWLKELQTYKEVPPLQAPEAYNLDGIIAEMKASKTASHVGE